MKNPQTSTFTPKSEGGSDGEEGGGGGGGVKSGTSAAKLSLNIISLSLVHYDSDKLLGSELVVDGQEVACCAFFLLLVDRAEATTQNVNELEHSFKKGEQKHKKRTE